MTKRLRALAAALCMLTASSAVAADPQGLARHGGRVDRFEVSGDGPVVYRGPFFVRPPEAAEQHNAEGNHLGDSGVVDIVTAHDGALYVLTSGEKGAIFRIAPESAILDSNKIMQEGRPTFIGSNSADGPGCQWKAWGRGNASSTLLATLLTLTAVLATQRVRIRRR